MQPRITIIIFQRYSFVDYIHNTINNGHKIVSSRRMRTDAETSQFLHPNIRERNIRKPPTFLTNT
jgi:hypothetical protein